MENEDELTFQLTKHRKLKCRLNVACTLFIFVVIFVIIVAVVTWGISDAFHTSTETLLIGRLTENALSLTLRRINTRTVQDAYNVSARAYAAGQFANIPVNITNVERLNSLMSHYLSEVSVSSKIATVLYGCGNWYVTVLKGYTFSGVAAGSISFSASMQVAQNTSGFLTNTTSRYYNISTGVPLSNGAPVNRVGISSFGPQFFRAYPIGQPSWTPVTFQKDYETRQPLPVYSTFVVTRYNENCGVLVESVLYDSIVTAWLNENTAPELANATFVVIDSTTRNILFDNTPYSTFITETTGNTTSYKSILVDNSESSVVREAAQYISPGLTYNVQYRGTLGLTYLATIPFTERGLNWTYVVIIPTATLFPSATVSWVTFVSTLAIVIFAAICSFLLARVVSIPVQQLTRKMQRLSGGEWRTEKPLSFLFITEFEKMQGTFMVMEQNLKANTFKLDGLVRQRTKELERALEEAGTANRFKSNFLANMSHEIRTPLHGILSLITFLMESKLSNDQMDWCKDIRSSTMALTQVLNDILDLSKVEAGKMLLECIQFDLLNICEELVTLFYGSIMENKKKNGLDLLVQYSPRLPRVLWGDPIRVRQILSNLLSNAVKFTETGSILLVVEPYSEAAPSGYELPGNGDPDLSILGIRIQVIDTGIGMTEEQRKIMFAQYTQADVSTTRKYGGTGLGLAIIKNLIEMFGGSISVASAVGKGSVFTFDLFLGTRTDMSESVFKATAAPGSDPLKIDQGVTGKGLMITCSKQLFQSILIPLSNAEVRWRRTKSPSKANALIDSEKYVAIIVDSPYLEDLRNGETGFHFVRDIKSLGDTKIIFLRDGRTPHSLIPSFVHSVWNKPLKPTLISTHWIETTAPSSRKSTHAAVEADYTDLNLHLLLAEDNVINQKVATILLKKMNCTAVICSNGYDALEKYKSTINDNGESIFDAVLMDVMMPIMDGIAATTHIREYEVDKKLPRIPIIALTAHAMVDDKDKCISAGMDGYLSKPLDKELMASILWRLTRRRSRGSSG